MIIKNAPADAVRAAVLSLVETAASSEEGYTVRQLQEMVERHVTLNEGLFSWLKGIFKSGPTKTKEESTAEELAKGRAALKKETDELVEKISKWEPITEDEKDLNLAGYTMSYQADGADDRSFPFYGDKKNGYITVKDVKEAGRRIKDAIRKVPVKKES